MFLDANWYSRIGEKASSTKNAFQEKRYTVHSRGLQRKVQVLEVKK